MTDTQRLIAEAEHWRTLEGHEKNGLIHDLAAALEEMEARLREMEYALGLIAEHATSAWPREAARAALAGLQTGTE